MESSWLRAVLRVWVVLVLAFLFIPIVIMIFYLSGARAAGAFEAM